VEKMIERNLHTILFRSSWALSRVSARAMTEDGPEERRASAQRGIRRGSRTDTVRGGSAGPTTRIVLDRPSVLNP
jgi:hypothetical protein